MKRRRRTKIDLEQGIPSDPWLVEEMVIGNKVTTLVDVLVHAQLLMNREQRDAIEASVGQTMLALVEEINRLQVENHGLQFRVNVACDGYAGLTESDVPREHDTDSYLAGAAEAAMRIREALENT